MTTVTHRRQPIVQTTLEPSHEHVSLAGILTEASILSVVEGQCRVVFLMFMPIRQEVASCWRSCNPKKPNTGQGRELQAALCAFAAFPELKTVILVDEDVDIFDTDDVFWALMTRFQSDVDTVTIPGVRCHPLDPSQSPLISRVIPAHWISCKTIYDCTVPFMQKDRFRRSAFLEGGRIEEILKSL